MANVRKGNSTILCENFTIACVVEADGEIFWINSHMNCCSSVRERAIVINETQAKLIPATKWSIVGETIDL